MKTAIWLHWTSMLIVLLFVTLMFTVLGLSRPFSEGRPLPVLTELIVSGKNYIPLLIIPWTAWAVRLSRESDLEVSSFLKFSASEVLFLVVFVGYSTLAAILPFIYIRVSLSQ